MEHRVEQLEQVTARLLPVIQRTERQRHCQAVDPPTVGKSGNFEGLVESLEVQVLLL